MTKLLEHFRSMQAMATNFISPGPYKVQHNADAGKLHNSGSAGASNAFINDMLYMLDGPEQREAETAAQLDAEVGTKTLARLEDELDQLRNDLAEARDKRAVADSDRDRAIKRLDVVKGENNDLRSRLFAAELAYAKLRGYTDRMADEQPPAMVPERRETALAAMPDGSRGSASHIRAAWGANTSSAEWFHR